MIGFHASHELYPPSYLLEAVVKAEQAGFSGAMCSDHFRPWLPKGHSGHVFSWLGAALHSTKFPIGSVHVPGKRCHPVISAQAIATLGEMFPGRYWVGLASGEALNESVLSTEWPTKSERKEYLAASADLIKRLLKGERVSVEGDIEAYNAYIYSRPTIIPTIYGAAISTETAQWMGGWADGLITVSGSEEQTREKIGAFYSNGGKAKDVIVQAAVGYGKTDKDAKEAVVRNWPLWGLSGNELESLASPEEFETRTRNLTPETLPESCRVSSDLERHVSWIENDFRAGATAVYLHYIGDDLLSFIKLFGSEVLPRVKRKIN